jgi:pimeloyl-ACP methyl ester carboxylesterase
MAVQHPERVEAMVLVAGGHRLVNGARERLVGFDFDAASPALQEHYLTYHPGGAAQLDRIFEEVRGLANNYSDFNFSPEQLSIVPTRTLLVWGDRDPTYPLDIGVEMYEALPNASLWVVPSQGHFPLWPEFDGSEDAASIFVSLVSDFLEATGES